MLSEKFGFLSDDSGFFGTMNIVGGFIGSLCFGFFLKQFKFYKLANVSIGVLCVASIIGFYFALLTETKWVVTVAYSF